MSSYQLVKQFSTQEPATCLQFTSTSIIIGTDRFFEVDLTNFAIEGQWGTGTMGRGTDGGGSGGSSIESYRCFTVVASAINRLIVKLLALKGFTAASRLVLDALL